MNDPTRTYSFDEEKTLALNLLAVARQIHMGMWKTRQANVFLLCELHQALFKGVRGHAGRYRREDWGSEHLVFGPNRSRHRSDVEIELQAVLADLQKTILQCEAHLDAPNFEEVALRAAVVAHAKVVQIHPFEDGNGRASRLLMNWVLVRLGLRPIAFESEKQAYNTMLNHYFATREIQPLVDLCLRLYPLE
jgi:Fic family protein